MDVTIRRAAVEDAESITGILQGIAAERIYTAIDQPWSVEEQRRYLASLSQREAFHVAESEGAIVGYQTLDLWAPSIRSMSHVAQLGTFLSPAWRGRGIGKALFEVTCAFARQANFSKLLIQVRSSNQGAQSFYKRLGFRECGRLTRQVRIAGTEDDEILMEYFL